MSPLLKYNFDLLLCLRLWKEVAERGTDPLVKEYGLCAFVSEHRRSCMTNLCLKHHLRKDFSDFVYPFGGRLRFYQDQDRGKMHLNHERVAWVDKMIAELEKENEQPRLAAARTED